MSTSLLLHMNDNLTDNSSFGHVATGYNVSYTAGKFSNGVNFNGSSTYLTIPTSSTFSFGTGDFTIDLWFKYTYSYENANTNLIGSWGTGGDGWCIYIGKSDSSLKYGVPGVFEKVVATLSSGSTYHFALVRSSGTIKGYLNGNQTGATSTDAWDGITTNLYIGNQYGHFFNGWIDEVRILKGEAAWTSNFTPPSYQYENGVSPTTETKLLLHMNDNLTDSSGKGHVATGTAITYAAGKFSTNAASFNGTSSYVSIPASSDFNFSTSDFTVDFWVYFNTISASPVSLYSGGLAPTYNDMQLYAYNNAGNVSLNFSISGIDNIFIMNLNLSTMYHIAMVGNYSAGTVKFYIDGILKATKSDNYSAMKCVARLELGRMEGQGYLNGWLEEVRILKGIAAWTSNFTPPTSEYNYTLSDTISIAGQTLTKSASNSITCSTSAISAISIIASDSFYNTSSNWKYVTFVYNCSGAKKNLRFFSSNSFAAISDKFDKSGTWSLTNIFIKDIYDGVINIRGSDLPVNQNFTVS